MGAAANMPEVNDKHLGKVEAIILSMTLEERSDPSILNPSRKNRIAKGAGVSINEVNRIVKQFEQMKKLLKQFSGMGGNKRKGGLGGLFGNKFKLPF
jgi:signal peptide binding domain